MAKICWKTTASIGLIVFSQAASAAPDGGAAAVGGNSAYRNLSQLDDPKSNAGSVVGFLHGKYRPACPGGRARGTCCGGLACGYEGTAGPIASSRFVVA
jgi:hypothetical protein